MDIEGIQIISVLLALIVAWPVAIFKGNKWAASNPDKRPFKWGYFQSVGAMIGFVGSALAALGFSSSTVRYSERQTLEVFIVWGLLLGLCGVFMYRRNRWWWIAGILLSFNPLLWIVNGIYLFNRWKEMASQKSSTSSDQTSIRGRGLPTTCYIYQNGAQMGPFHMDQIKAMWKSGQITADALFCAPGEEEWKELLPVMIR